MTGLAHVDVRIDTTNPNAVPRLLELLRHVAVIGRDDFGHLHTTDLTVFDSSGDVVWGAAVTCAEQTVRDGELSALVRLLNEHGAQHELVVDGIFALAARLLHAAEIGDPFTGTPLSSARAHALAEELGGLVDDLELGAELAPRDWVIAQVLATSRSIAEHWTDSLEDTAAELAQRHRVPTPAWHQASGEHEAATTLWPQALQLVQEWLS
jgi:hypothetical protein